MEKKEQIVIATGVAGIVTCAVLAIENAVLGSTAALNHQLDASVAYAALTCLDVASIPPITKLAEHILTHRGGGDPPSGGALS